MFAVYTTSRISSNHNTETVHGTFRNEVYTGCASIAVLGSIETVFMWPLAGGVFVLGALLPSALLWLNTDVTAEAGLWKAAGAYNAVDAFFALTSILFLWIAVQYGYTRGSQKKGAHKKPAPYPGAWVEADGHQAVPQGFPSYLALAFVVTVIVPTLVLAGCLLSSSDTTKALAASTLAPYLVVFLPQILLETKFLNRSFMTPVLPVLFAYYRLWQFIRSLSLVAGAKGSPADQHTWLVYYLLSLLAFWVFDSGCTMVWLPGMYEWQLQNVALLSRLSKQRQAQQDAKGGGHAGGAENLSGPALAAKLRHRWRLAAGHHPAASGDFDSYSFGG